MFAIIFHREFFIPDHCLFSRHLLLKQILVYLIVNNARPEMELHVDFLVLFGPGEICHNFYIFILVLIYCLNQLIMMESHHSNTRRVS